ncbi:MAG TPA: hypothetical protein VJJ73_00320 [Candidatus Paceibacterota bacterium]
MIEGEPNNLERDSSLREVLGYIEENSRVLRNEGVPVDDVGRIDMSFYLEDKHYSKPSVKNHIKMVDEKASNRYEREHGKVSKDMHDIGEERLKTSGEKFEILKTAIFQKNMGENYVVVRSSLYDDNINHVDNIIMNRETGDIVCAIDETTGKFPGDSNIEKKKSEIMKMDVKGGASLVYGIGISDGQIVLKESEHVPIFYLVMPREQVDNELKIFNAKTNASSQSLEEKTLFNVFAGHIILQTDIITARARSSATNLPREFVQRMASFKQFLSTKFEIDPTSKEFLAGVKKRMRV